MVPSRVLATAQVAVPVLRYSNQATGRSPEVAVVGQRDAEWGEVVVAFVVAEGVDAQALDAHCLAHIARFKRPKHYRFVAALPKNNYGKVLKTALREQLVMSTHNLGQARRLGTRVAYLEDGALVADRAAESFFTGEDLPEPARQFLKGELPWHT